MGLLLCAPAFATDWKAILSSKPSPLSHPEFTQAMQRIEAADMPTALAAVAELNSLYQSNPELRSEIGGILKIALEARNYQAVSRVGNSGEILQPIVAALIDHLTDSDPQIRVSIVRLFVAMQPGPPADILDSLIHLIDTETDYVNQVAAVASVARYCTAYKSQPAIFALVRAAGPDQANFKRQMVLEAIGSDATLCTDPALVGTVLAGLQSDNGLGLLPAAAAHAAMRFDPTTTARPLMADLERVATTGQEGPAAEAARQTLEQFQLRQQR
jgi:hypothetical protein